MNLAGNFTTKRTVIYMTNGRENFTVNHLHNTWAFTREDPPVAQLLDLFNLAEYRQIFADQQMDIEALAAVDLDTDNLIIGELRLQLKDIPAFRLVLTTAKSLMQARKLATNNAPPGF